MTKENEFHRTWQERFRKVHMSSYPTPPSHPEMLFGAVSNYAGDVAKAKALLWGKARPQGDPRNN